MQKAIKNKSFWARLKLDVVNNPLLYIMIAPVIGYVALFCYGPMYGIVLAFLNYRIKDGIFGSEWVGFANFERFIRSFNFLKLMENTLAISVLSLIVGFFVPIGFALMLNYVTSRQLKKTVQMVSYAPHFISVVVICGMLQIIFASNGPVNAVIMLLGFDKIDFLAEASMFRPLYVGSGVWQGMGWSSIIYISALSGVDYQIHEAAIIDGATKLQRIRHIDIPSIKSTIIMLLILAIGGLMGVGFDKAYLLQNDLNLETSEVLSTYVYKMGMIKSDYSFSTAVGLFNTVINLILIVSANYISKKLADESLF
ncbi:MAG: sugar ABC transporter permease [Clostridia bacterium]|nr:sugar ABC transporter permease [Clostridia bacterium]